MTIHHYDFVVKAAYKFHCRDVTPKYFALCAEDRYG
jgi:hypothetical protein